MPTPTSGRWRVETKPDENSRWTRIGRAHYTQSIIRAKFTPLTDAGDIDSARPRAELLIALDEQNIPQIYDLAMHATDDPLTPTSARLPLRAMARAAVACGSYRLEGETVHFVAGPVETFQFKRDNVKVEHLAPKRLAALERDARMRPRGNPVTDDDLRKVGAIVARTPYRERRQAVSAALGVSYYVAKARIAEARRRGFIPPG